MTATNTGTGDTEVDLKTVASNKLRITGVEAPGVKDGTTGVKLENIVLGGNKPGTPAISPTADGYVALDKLGASRNSPWRRTDPQFQCPVVHLCGPAVYPNRGGLEWLSRGRWNTAADNVCCQPQLLPNPVRPNNVLAPYWSDLNGTGAPGLYAATLTGGGQRWMVFEWRVFEYGETQLKVFQTWIGLNGVQDITFNYDPNNMPRTDCQQPAGRGCREQ